MLSAQTPTQSVSNSQPAIREPELIAPQQVPTSPGKCGDRRFEWALVSLDIAEDGSPQQVSVINFSDADAKELSMEAVRADRFTPAEQDGKPVTAHREIMVEMYVCSEKVKLTDGKKEEQVRLEAQPRQTLYLLPAEHHGIPGAYRVGGGVSPPVAISAPNASYTPEARQNRVQGEVIITIIVDANGMPQNPRVVRPLPAGLNEAAIEAVRKYRFRPAKKDGKTPVPVMVTIVVNFRL
jgi:TonB family protein